MIEVNINTSSLIDGFLDSFIVPILPDMVENRIGLDHSYTQTVTSWLLGQNAIVSLVLRIPLGHFADKSSSKMSWLLWALVASLLGTVCTALAPSRKLNPKRSIPRSWWTNGDQSLCFSRLDWCRPFQKLSSG